MKVVIEVDARREARAIAGSFHTSRYAHREPVSNRDRACFQKLEIEIMDLGFKGGSSSFWVNTVSLSDPITEGAFLLSSAISP